LRMLRQRAGSIGRGVPLRRANPVPTGNRIGKAVTYERPTANCTETECIRRSPPRGDKPVGRGGTAVPLVAGVAAPKASQRGPSDSVGAGGDGVDRPVVLRRALHTARSFAGGRGAGDQLVRRQS